MNELDIFAMAMELATPQERAQYLAETCGGDTTLRARIEALLRSSDKAGSFLEMPPAELATSVEELRAAASDGISLGFLRPSDKPGSLGRLDHYEILEVVGSGGMGIVLKARDEKLQRVVAIKMMAEALAASPIAHRRFVGEAQAAAAIRDDHVVSIYAVEDSGPIPYLVMELISGVSLQQRLEQTGPLEMREICSIGMQVASGLAAAHAQGVIHRDIKPANILLENGVGRVKITDFGLARVADDASTSQTGLIAGTPQYMSPEQARGEIIDPRSDLFSLGSTLYAMCTGRAPFRASSAIAVLKRVCEDRPSPIQEVNRDIPQWLVDLIDQLQAKAPAERVQSAGEVAEHLRQYLAGRLDTAELAAVSTPPRTSRGKRPRWALAAAAAGLLCLTCALSLTEATGVTQVVPTVVRIVIGEGTLVVETGDPAVNVTVERDGGLVITGAGLEEIRLRPGSYRVHADKGGQPIPLDKDLVTVARGGRAIVKVKLESSTAAAAAKVEKGAFALLGGKGVEERKFDTLAEAVLGASDGDTIEIRGNGPFLTQPILIHQTLTIRAGDGFRPVIRISPGLPGDDWLLATHAPLVLEGLDIREVSKARSQPALNRCSVIYCDGNSLYLANCRLLQEQPIHEAVALIMAHSNIILRNCEFHTPGPVAAFGNDVPVRFVMDNCLGLGTGMAAYLNYADASKEASVELRRNTFVMQQIANVGFSVAPDPPPAVAEEKRVRFEASANVFDIQAAMLAFETLEPFRPKPEWQKAEHAEAVFMPLVGWREKRNLYRSGATSIHWSPRQREFLRIAPGNLKDWQRRWNLTDTGSFEGTIHFHGGNLLAKGAIAPENLTPEDFRLRPDSAGYRAGKDGKDLGADVDLVGPGPAYERWKKTPEYQEWLKETGQKK